MLSYHHTAYRLNITGLFHVSCYLAHFHTHTFIQINIQSEVYLLQSHLDQLGALRMQTFNKHMKTVSTGTNYTFPFLFYIITVNFSKLATTLVPSVHTVMPSILVARCRHYIQTELLLIWHLEICTRLLKTVLL